MSLAEHIARHRAEKAAAARAAEAREAAAQVALLARFDGATQAIMAFAGELAANAEFETVFGTRRPEMEDYAEIGRGHEHATRMIRILAENTDKLLETDRDEPDPSLDVRFNMEVSGTHGEVEIILSVGTDADGVREIDRGGPEDLDALLGYATQRIAVHVADTIDEARERGTLPSAPGGMAPR